MLRVAVFKDRPPRPPSKAQMLLQTSGTDENYLQSLKNLFKNPGFILLTITYGRYIYSSTPVHLYCESVAAVVSDAVIMLYLECLVSAYYFQDRQQYYTFAGMCATQLLHTAESDRYLSDLSFVFVKDMNVRPP